MEKEAYVNYIKRNKKGKIPPTACVVCGEDDPEVIEMHHVEGRNNSDWIEPLCKNCHSKITTKQNRVSPKARSSNASLQNLRAFNIISIGALVVELGNSLINVGYEMVENV
ncbi:HNH endonuclease signature motif containing protein [Methanolobus sp.]|uniref:HNH endonuclease signature motif containing protein n=1 Tax=Methanolobus sp. TaxID=1874737 RepID=UPI0025D1DB0B|nr:HNH endonuclease signature motif containing protein [Methanolobus sp.]